jgi:uncharacterized protein
MAQLNSLIQDYLGTVTVDFDAWLNLLHDDVVFEMPYGPSAGIYGRLVGKSEIAKAIKPFLASVPALEFKNVEIHLTQNPDEAYATFEADAPVPATGKQYTQSYISLFRRRDDKVVFMREYFDPTQLNAFAS